MDQLENSGGQSVPEEPRRRRFGRSARLDPELEAQLHAAQRAILDRFERGLEAVGQHAVSLMREATEEVWHATGAELGGLKERVIAELSRDQAIRGLIAHSDERFQSLDARVARIETNLETVDRAAKGLAELIAEAHQLEAFQRGPEHDGRRLDPENRLGALEETLRGLAGTTDALQTHIDEGLRALRETVDGALRPVADTADEPHGSPGTNGAAVEQVRERVSAIQQYLVQVGDYFGERDRTLSEWLQATAQHNAAALRGEVRRAVRTLEERITDGGAGLEEEVRAVVSAQVAAVQEGIEQHAVTLREALALAQGHAEDRASALEATLTDRLDGTDAALSGVDERLEAVRHTAERAADRLSATLHERMADLTDDMRAETEVLRARLLERTSEAGEMAVRGVEERLGRLSELVAAALGWAVDEVESAIRGETLRSVEVGMADFLAAMDRRFVQVDQSLDRGLARTSRELVERIEGASAGTGEHVDALAVRVAEVVDRAERIAAGVDEAGRRLEERLGVMATQMDGRLARVENDVEARLGETRGHLDARLDRMDRSMHLELVESREHVEARFDRMDHSMQAEFVESRQHVDTRLDRVDRSMQAGLGALEESVAQRTTQAFESVVDERLAPATSGVAASIESLRASLEESLARVLSDRVASLGQMVRSDNRVLADRLTVVEEQAAAKEAVRSINELAAALPGEIGDALDRRLAALGELFREENKQTIDMVTRAARALADRLDKTASTIGERFDREVETVVDSIGDTMATLATGLQRATPTRTRGA